MKDIAELKGVKLDDTKAASIKKIIHWENEEIRKLQKSKDKAFKNLNDNFNNIFNKIENDALNYGFTVEWISYAPVSAKLKEIRKNEKLDQFKLEAYQLISNELDKECKNHNNEWNSLETSYRHAYKDILKKHSEMAKSIGCFPHGNVGHYARTIL